MNVTSLALRPIACFALLCGTMLQPAPLRAAQLPVHYEGHAAAYHVKQGVSLGAYSDAHAVALGPSGAIAGDAVLKGSRRCLLWSGGVLLDISPAGWEWCALSAGSSNGTLAGRVGTASKIEGFIYRAGRGYVIPSAQSFSAINASGLALGTKSDGSQGVFDGPNGTWLVFQDLGRGCAISEPIALNDRFVFGAATCADGVARYGLADSGHYLSLTLPKDLRPSSILTAADQLVLYNPNPGGHAYLWWIVGNRPPLDLGDAPGFEFGTYTPIAANAEGVAVGENYLQFFSWVRTPADGTRELDALIVPANLFGLSVADVDEAGEVLVQAFDFDSAGSQVWLILQPASH